MRGAIIACCIVSDPCCPRVPQSPGPTPTCSSRTPRCCSPVSRRQSSGATSHTSSSILRWANITYFELDTQVGGLRWLGGGGGVYGGSLRHVPVYLPFVHFSQNEVRRRCTVAHTVCLHQHEYPCHCAKSAPSSLQPSVMPYSATITTMQLPPDWRYPTRPSGWRGVQGAVQHVLRHRGRLRRPLGREPLLPGRPQQRTPDWAEWTRQVSLKLPSFPPLNCRLTTDRKYREKTGFWKLASSTATPRLSLFVYGYVKIRHNCNLPAIK